MMMKIHKIFAVIMLTVPSLLLQSCLKDQEDAFDQPSSIRMQTFLDNAQQTLVNASNGWILEYFPHKNQVYGGYVYTLRFTADSVYTNCELDPGYNYGSLYRMTNDDGPVLTFDTYNPALHYFSTPSSEMYESFGGDFELVIDSVGADVIKLHGKRSLTTMYMYKMTEDANSYLDKVFANIDGLLFASAKGNVGNLTAEGNVDLDNRQITLTSGEMEGSSAFVFTDKGIRLYKPIELGDVIVTEIGLDTSDFKLVGTAKTGETIDLKLVKPDGWKTFQELVGTYAFNSETPRDVEVVANPDGASYTLTGFSQDGPIQATYNKGAGSMNIAAQFCGQYAGYDLYLCPCDGSTYSTSGVFKGVNSEKDGVFSITFTNPDYPTFWIFAFKGGSNAGYLEKLSSPMILTKK